MRKNLRRAEKLLRNMSAVAEIQSAIALIRKHQADQRRGPGPVRRRPGRRHRRQPGHRPDRHFRRYAPGTILDAMAGTDYEFPAAAIDAARYVAVLQAELRAIAARLVMPEFMLTSDASNANYSSTMVAEGPAVKMFDRLQHDMIEDDLELLWRVVGHAVEAGRLPADAVRRWTFAPLRRRWPCATGCATPRPTRSSFATGRCRRRRWPCATAWIRARRGKRGGLEGQ